MSTDFEAIVLAAGYGRRISELTDRRPKPLLPVGPETPLALATGRLRAAGATRVTANAAHLAEQVVMAAVKLGIEALVERDGPTGTAGGVAAVVPTVRAAAIVVWNGDIVAEAAPGALVAALEGEAPIVLSVRGREQPGTGNVGVDERGRVVRLRGLSVPAGVEQWSTWFDGIHAMSMALRARLPSRGCLLADFWWPWLQSGGVITTLPSTGYWYDVGDLRSYARVNFDRYASSGPLTSGIELVCSVVAENATVSGSGRLERAIVWPRASTRAPLQDVIVRDDGRLVRTPGPDQPC